MGGKGREGKERMRNGQWRITIKEDGEVLGNSWRYWNSNLITMIFGVIKYSLIY